MVPVCNVSHGYVSHGYVRAGAVEPVVRSALGPDELVAAWA